MEETAHYFEKPKTDHEKNLKAKHLVTLSLLS
jgi:hypothetical protein